MSNKRKGETNLEMPEEKKIDEDPGNSKELEIARKKKEKKKAVLIGLNHPKLTTTVDIKEQILRMRNLLINRRGFSEDSITLMIQDDDDGKQHVKPTEMNIRRTLCHLVESAWPGDILFIHLIAYGCSDGLILTADSPDDQKHLEDSYFRALIIRALQKGCHLTFVSDCLIDPATECRCPKLPLPPVDLELVRPIEEVMEYIAKVGYNFHIAGYINTAPTKLCNVNILHPDEKTEDDHKSPRVILLMPFQRDPNTAPKQRYNKTELFFPTPAPPTKEASSSTTTPPQHTFYGFFTKTILDVIEVEETHDSKITNLELARGAQKDMEKLGGEIPSLHCSHHNHAYASFVC